jgi:hypothetical protein
MISGQTANGETQSDCHLFSELTPVLMGADGQARRHGCRSNFPARMRLRADAGRRGVAR